MQTPQLRIGRAVLLTGSMLPRTWEGELSKVTVDNSARLGIFANHLFCFVYHLNVLQAEFFILRRLFRNKITKHKLAGSNPSTCKMCS